VLEQFRKYGKVNWSWMGLQLQPLKDFNRNIYFDANEGVIVSETYPDSPARRAGIQARDRITRINGEAVTAITEEDLPAIRRKLALFAQDANVPMEVARNGQVVKCILKLQGKGKVEGDEFDCPRWDFTVKTINQFDNPDLYYHKKQGVFVYGIKYPGNAASCSLATQDIITRIDSKEINTLEEFKSAYTAAIKQIDVKHRITISVLRNGLLRQVVLDFARDYEKF
jgi:serine protease Do